MYAYPGIEKYSTILRVYQRPIAVLEINVENTQTGLKSKVDLLRHIKDGTVMF